MSELNNPYYRAADKVLELHRPWMQNSGTERAQAITNLLAALGSPDMTQPNGVVPFDPGVAALIGLCLFLKQHGGGITAVTTAHEELHRS